MDIGVLGPLLVGGTLNGPTALGLSPRDRVALAVRPGEVLGPDVLAEALWGEAPPDSWPKVVQGCIMRLRKALGAAVIETTPHGYRLVVHADGLDHRRFERLIALARDHLARGEPERTAYLVGEALELWRGRPLVDLEEWPAGRAEAERLCELRLDAEDMQTEAALRSGRHHEILSAAMSRVSDAPLRERRWALLAHAQYQSGRQGDALLTLRRARTTLSQELGLDPGPELVRLEQAILQQDPSLVAAAALPEPSATCPYPGLMAYDVQDSDVFFGRDSDVSACLDRLDAVGVLAVVGPSGCGKSSLVRAGVAAALERDGRRVVVITPGTRPLSALSTVRSLRSVLVVDQCEEALSSEGDLGEQAAFFDALVQHSRTGTLVLAFRADRLGGLSAHSAVARLVERGLYLLGAMGAQELRTAVEGPARRAGLRLETGLVDLVVREVEGEPGALPLLSHVLRQTWERREGSTLTVAGYTASGGVREAVAQSAEAVYEDVNPDQRPVLRDLMLRLVSPNPDGDPVRTRVARHQIATDEEHEQLIEKLVRARLVSSDDNSLEIAHEALARVWPRLRAWLDDDVEGQRILRHLAVTADTWESMQRPDSELYRGVRLAKAIDWLQASSPDLTTAEREFLDTSERMAEQERANAEQQVRHERRTNRRLRMLLAGLAALLVVAIVAGTLAITAAKRADTQTLAAQRQAVAADARRVGAQALVSGEADTSLMLALAGVAAHNSVDTRNNLLAEVDRLPGLLKVTHTDVAAIFTVSTSAVDGRVAVGAPFDGAVLHDPTTLRELGRNHVGGAQAAEYSPDGKLLAVSSGDRMSDGAGRDKPLPIRLLDADGRLASSQPGGIPEGFVAYERASFSPNGRWLAVMLQKGDSFLAAVWDLRAPGATAALVAMPTWARFVGVSTDGRTLFTEGSDFRVWDLPAGTLRRTVAFEELGVPGLQEDFRLSPDGRTIAIPLGTEVALLDAATLRPRQHAVSKGHPGQVSFSADGTRLAANDDGFAVWDLTGPAPLEIFRTDRWGTAALALSPDGRTLYTAGINSRLLAWDVEGSRRFLPVRPGPPRDEPDGPARVSDDGQAIAYWGGQKLQARDVTTGKTGPLIRPGDKGGRWNDLAWSPDHQRLVGVYGDDLVQVWDPWTGRRIARKSIAPDVVSTAAFTKDGRILLVGTGGGLVHVLDAATLKPARPSLAPGVKGIFGLEASPDHHTLLIGGESGPRRADYVSGQVASFPPPAFGIYSPDGKRIGVIKDGQIGLLNAQSMDWIAKPSAAQPYGGPYSAFSSDGTKFATSDLSKVAVWDGRTGAFIGAVAVKDAAMGFLDPSTLVIAGADGSVRTWDLRTQTWTTKACQIAGRALTQDEWQSFLPDRAYRDACPHKGR
jgi:WD40 repeat protein/DNA-binding SARP family transcriptional activator/energy-coupling factor transporter ATP-binding protein EcfA2